MRVYLSVDMEGVAGVVHEDQTNPLDPACAREYQRFAKLMTLEANAAIAGALDAGAKSVVVNDAHWTMRNLLAEELHPAAELISGGSKPGSMMEGVAGADAAICLGYHAKAGTARAILDHTYTDKVLDLRFNGRSFGEFGLMAAVAGEAGVPIVMASGDEAFGAEVEDLLGDSCVTAVVKQASARHSALSLSPEAARNLIRQTAAVALTGPFPSPFAIAPPIVMEISFALTHYADMAQLMAGCRRMDGRIVRCDCESMTEALSQFRTAVALASG